MPITVSGTTVVSDSRGLLNVASIDSTTKDTIENTISLSQYARNDQDEVISGTLEVTGLGVGTTAPTGGEIRATGDITAFYSDERLKNRQENISDAVEKITSLNGFYYTPNQTAQDLGYDDALQVGVSAQEVQRVLPEVVTKAPISDREEVNEEYLAVKYDKLVPLLIESIKELKQEIEDLKTKR